MSKPAKPDWAERAAERMVTKIQAYPIIGPQLLAYLLRHTDKRARDQQAIALLDYLAGHAKQGNLRGKEFAYAYQLVGEWVLMQKNRSRK